ncbi:MAG: hypothetical protein HY800_10360 [Ignavibacteriales bacterium]|nr:hypothetical protein [Ignavibacteriales bacterium]
MISRPEVVSPRPVYNGGSLNQRDYQTPRGNRPVKARKRSPLNLIALLFTISIIIVFYIWNKISVNRLATEINELTNHHEKLLNINEFLRAEINRKSSLERIEKLITTQRLGLVAPKEQPIWFELDESRIENILR